MNDSYPSASIPPQNSPPPLPDNFNEDHFSAESNVPYPTEQNHYEQFSEILTDSPMQFDSQNTYSQGHLGAETEPSQATSNKNPNQNQIQTKSKKITKSRKPKSFGSRKKKIPNTNHKDFELGMTESSMTSSGGKKTSPLDSFIKNYFKNISKTLGAKIVNEENQELNNFLLQLVESNQNKLLEVKKFVETYVQGKTRISNQQYTQYKIAAKQDVLSVYFGEDSDPQSHLKKILQKMMKFFLNSNLYTNWVLYEFKCKPNQREFYFTYHKQIVGVFSDKNFKPKFKKLSS
jgi:hypothetical protein